MRRLPSFIIATCLVTSTVVGGLYIQKRASIGKQPDGSFVVSTNQRLTPVGKLTTFEYSRPKDLSLAPGGKYVALLNTNKLVVLDEQGDLKSELKLGGAPLGVVWSPDARQVFASNGGGKIVVANWDGTKLEKNSEIDVHGTIKADPHVAGLAISPDGATLYAAMTTRNAVAVIELSSGKVSKTVDVGVAPYHLSISPDGGTLAVSNRGGARVSAPSQQLDPNTGQPFNGSGIATQLTADTAAQIDPQTDAVWRGTVSLIDTKNLSVRDVSVRNQPSGTAFSADGKSLYVSESDSDSVSFVDVIRGRASGNLSLRPAEDPQFGQIPTSVATSADGKRIYVSLGGANSVAVVDIVGEAKVLGYVPCGWYPIALKSDGDRLFVASSKGFGSRPTNKSNGFGVHDSVGLLQSIPFADIADLKSTTRTVAKNNGWIEPLSARASRKPVPIPQRVGEPSLFKHVVYIIKENLSYDVAMGDVAAGNGDPSLCLFGENVTPNQHALAKEFVLLDNFYTSGTNSADGHQWTASAISNGYSEQNYSSNVRSYPYNGGDALSNSPAGFLWTAANRSGKSVRVYGEFVNNPKVVNPATGRSPSWTQAWADYTSGKNSMIVEANTENAALRPFLCKSFIGFPSIISDQYRADQFLKELSGWESNDGMPNLSIMLLPNNHTSGTSPSMPTPRAMIADNDLALGRIVEAIAKSKFWKDTLILVVEDDAQNGVDHLDGHRCPAFCISPYTRRGAVVSDLYNHTSIIRTIGLVLGIPPMNRFDRTGSPMTACFTDQANLKPYVSRKNNIPLDEMNPKPNKLTGKSRELAIACSQMDWSNFDRANAATLAEAIWNSVKPNAPFPNHLYHVASIPDADGD